MAASGGWRRRSRQRKPHRLDVLIVEKQTVGLGGQRGQDRRHPGVSRARQQRRTGSWTSRCAPPAATSTTRTPCRNMSTTPRGHRDTWQVGRQVGADPRREPGGHPRILGSRLHAELHRHRPDAAHPGRARKLGTRILNKIHVVDLLWSRTGWWERWASTSSPALPCLQGQGHDTGERQLRL